VEQSSQGTFVPHAREDILTAAMGKPEHPGRVRGVGRGVGIRQYFGAPSPTQTAKSKLTPEELNVIVDEVRQQVIAQLVSMGYSQQPPPSQATVHSPRKVNRQKIISSFILRILTFN